MRLSLRRQLRGGRRGFTVIELIVVMIIVVVAFLAVRPQFGKALQANRDRAALRKKLEEEMLELAKNLEFERAAVVRDEIHKLDEAAGGAR